MLQLTNASLGALVAGTPAIPVPVPLGVMTREVNRRVCKPTFSVTTTANNATYLNEAGYYKISYQANVVATAAGNLTFNLVIDGVTVQTVTVTAAAAGAYVLSLNFITRVNCGCNARPFQAQLVQIMSTGGAISSGSSNIIIEKIA